MSIQAVAAVLEADVGEVAAKMLLICIANAHNTGTGVCCPSIERLAKESGMVRTSVKKWLRWLADEDFIVVEERMDDSGRQMANAYRLRLGEGSKFAPSQSLPPANQLTPRGVNMLPPTIEPEEKPEISISSADARDGFAELIDVLDEAHATALLNHFAGLGNPLTAYTARLKARQLDQYPDPNLACDEMVSNGWKNFKPGWMPRDRRAGEEGKAANPGDTKTSGQNTSLTAQRRVSRSLEPELWQRCCNATGHRPTLTGSDNGWAFDAALVDSLVTNGGSQ